MGNIELVVKISEEVYKNIQSKSTEIQAEGYTLENAILNGILLPKRHGQEPCDDCISRQYLLDNCVVDKVTMPYVPVNKIENAPPVTPQLKTGH